MDNLLKIDRKNLSRTILQKSKYAILMLVPLHLSILLDPLENASRYPDSDLRLNEANPYVIHFNRIHSIISQCLELSKPKDNGFVS